MWVYSDIENYYDSESCHIKNNNTITSILQQQLLGQSFLVRLARSHDSVHFLEMSMSMRITRYEFMISVHLVDHVANVHAWIPSPENVVWNATSMHYE